jgi:hypothetical protein
MAEPKITVFYEKDFQGHQVDLPAGSYTRAQLESRGIQNNTISSVKVPPGLKTILYKGDNFTDDQMQLVADAEELDWMHNNASSIKVLTVPMQPRATFFYQQGFQGKDVDLPPGQYTKDELERYGIDENTISSVKVPSGLRVVLYKGDNFSDDQLPLTADTPQLGAMDNNTSSIKIMTA